MASTLVKIDIHLIFHVKSTSPYIRDCDLVRVCAYISGIIRKTESIPIIVNGMSDHIHILCSLPKTIALSDFVRTIKSESSRWVKGIDKHYAKFAWQEGYGAFSVSPTLLEKTENYIKISRNITRNVHLLMNTSCFWKHMVLVMMKNMRSWINGVAPSGLFGLCHFAQGFRHVVPPSPACVL